MIVLNGEKFGRERERERERERAEGKKMGDMSYNHKSGISTVKEITSLIEWWNTIWKIIKSLFLIYI